jgi:hypothetical protein
MNNTGYVAETKRREWGGDFQSSPSRVEFGHEAYEQGAVL